MTTDALFGPDGTQLPDPLPVLPDPLVGPGTAGGAGVDQGGGPMVPVVPMPAVPDPTAIREAIRAALSDEPIVRRATEEPAEPPEQQIASLRTPPSGIPVQRPYPPGTVPPRQESARLRRQPAGSGYSPRPPSAVSPATRRLQPTGRPPRPPAAQLPPRSVPMQRTAPIPSGHLTQTRRSSSGGWIGCIVVLIFVAVVAFNLIGALIEAFTGG